MDPKILIFIPTYNERENVERIAAEILALNIPGLHLLFIDDNSQDGTGEVLESLAANNNALRVMHRKGKLGVGSAHKDGIAYAYDQGYQKLITMDADFTHSPSKIRELMAQGETFDVVVTSRYMEKHSLKGWNPFRKTLTWTGHFLTRYLLGLRYDASGAFRFYNLEKVSREIFKKVASDGYSFFFESLFILNYNHHSIAEIPIMLPARTYGESKMRWGDVFKSIEFLMKIFFRKLFRPESFQIEKIEALKKPSLRA